MTPRDEPLQRPAGELTDEELPGVALDVNGDSSHNTLPDADE
jgi:hypothetical protein